MSRKTLIVETVTNPDTLSEPGFSGFTDFKDCESAVLARNTKVDINVHQNSLNR